MKYETEIEGQTIELELDERDGRLVATIGKRRYEMEVVRPEDGIYLLFAGDAVYEARVAPEQDSLQVTLRGKTISAKVIDRKHRRGSADHEGESQKQLVAPMPGKVVRVLLTVGAEVTTGQGVVVVEAMKMQNEIKAPKAGRLLELRVREGDTVTANQVLAVVE